MALSKCEVHSHAGAAVLSKIMRLGGGQRVDAGGNVHPRFAKVPVLRKSLRLLLLQTSIIPSSRKLEIRFSQL